MKGGPQTGKLSREFWWSWLGFLPVSPVNLRSHSGQQLLIIDRTDASPAISTINSCSFWNRYGPWSLVWRSRLKHFALDTQLIIFIGVQTVGFAILWFSHDLQISFLGVLIAGLGVSNQFALASLRMIDFSEAALI
jgi:hypothetical protein